MILVVVALSTVACGGRRELPKSAVLASLLLSPGLLPRRRVRLGKTMNSVLLEWDETCTC